MSGSKVGAVSARWLLRLRLALMRTHPLTLAAAVLLLAVMAGLCWSAYAVAALRAAHDARMGRAAQARGAALAARTAAPMRAALPGVPAMPASTSASASVAAPAPDNLAAFYGALGERSRAEQQVKTLFALAAQSGLTLAQGEYKSAYDPNARLHTYQVSLPVKGSYAAIWQFAFGALRAIPFASLDDIGFRRDGVKDAQVEARLRLTLYLADRPDAGGGGAP